MGFSNPFDLRGPEFLEFYLVLVVLTAALVWLIRWILERGDDETIQSAAKAISQDPYQMAALRGGRDEVIRVAVLSLIERGLLKGHGSELGLEDPQASDKVRKTLDKAIVLGVAAKMHPRELFQDELVRREAEQFVEPAKAWNLRPGPQHWATRAALMIAGLGLLWGVAGTKIAVALSRGHHNIGFLVILSILAAVLLGVVTMPQVTAAGRRAQRQLRQLFDGLHRRRHLLSSNKTASELTFLAAVFGMSALPLEFARAMRDLRIDRDQCATSSGFGGGSCGGGGCGGGGCGGGCGGCG